MMKNEKGRKDSVKESKEVARLNVTFPAKR